MRKTIATIRRPWRRGPGMALVAAIGLAVNGRAVEWWTLSPHQAATNHSVLEETIVASGKYLLTDAGEPGRKALTATNGGLVLDSRVSYSGANELRARVRLRTDSMPTASIIFRAAKTACPETEISLTMAVSRSSAEAITCTINQGGKSYPFTYRLRAYTIVQPGWPQDFRTRVEQDMAALPDHNIKWLEVRIELSKGQARFWVDDRLLMQKTDPALNPDGSVQIQLSEGAQLAAYHAAKLPETPDRFVPIRLGGYANARTFMAGAAAVPDTLPPSDKAVLIHGIPFVFPGVNGEGNDHLNVGRSLYRYANMEGYFPTYEASWAGSLWRDPARIQLRIPNGPYDRLYLIAASADERNALPRVTAMFYRPSAGFAEYFEGMVPQATAESTDTKPLAIALSNGRKANLWLVEITLDPAKLASLADLDIVEMELTKKVYQYRSYPDPIVYGWHQGGPPSAVHIYAATLSTAPVGFGWQPDKFGHVWTTPEVPAYTAMVTNRTDSVHTGKLSVTTRSYDVTEETRQEKPVALAPQAAVAVSFSLPVKLNGYHDVTATLEIAGQCWTEKRSFVRLAPDTRTPRWMEGRGALFGYWSYHGGHYTPKADHIVRLMTQAGARQSVSFPSNLAPETEALVAQHWGTGQAGAWEVAPQPWAKDDPYDPAKYDAYKKEVIEKFTKARAGVPEAYRPDQVYFYAEPHISTRLTAGNYPEYWGGAPYAYTDEEKANLRMYMVTSKCVAEAIRAKWPELKILIPWGDPLFAVPLLRAGFPTNLIDGSGLDICGFERLPEQQLHQVSLHRLYELRSEYAKAGILHPRLQYVEGIFVPTEPGACSWRDQMDIYNRWALISMAYGVTRFYSGWFAFDCGDWYGAEHYGGCGIQRRIPYCDPKPAYAAYATITEKLNEANFDGWLKTGSLTTYALRFKGPKGNVYTLWNIRGKRSVTLTLAADAAVQVTDVMNNSKILQSKDCKITLSTDPSVIYLTSTGAVVSVTAGVPDHSDARPASDAILVADLGDGSWKYTSQRNSIYENNNFDTMRYPGRFSQTIQTDSQHGNVLESKLERQESVHELMPWYNILAPRKPVELRGAPSAIGLWVEGASDWGRVVYCLRDAEGERWISIGAKDQWNCDDLHSWSSFNFDGWRYVRFELPGHLGYDNYRKYGTTWWRSEGGDGVVDLPLKLESIIVEQRSHVLYVNDIQPVAANTVRFGKLYAEYDDPTDATKEAVRGSRLRMPAPQEATHLPNPIAEMEKSGTGTPTILEKLEPPAHAYDGTRVHVRFKEAEGARNYFVWVSAHADGRGAVNVTPHGAKSGVLATGLRPGVEFSFWVVYEDAQGRMSKPSAAVKTILEDMFKEK